MLVDGSPSRRVYQRWTADPSCRTVVVELSWGSIATGTRSGRVHLDGRWSASIHAEVLREA